MGIISLFTNKFAIILLAVGIMFGYWKWSQREIDTLKDNNAVYAASFTRQQNTIQSLKSDAKKAKMINNVIQQRSRVYERNISNLKEKLEFSKNKKPRSLEKIAKKKPLLLAKIINRGSRFRIRCLEIATGSIVDSVENKATGKDRNNLCPEFFNYEER